MEARIDFIFLLYTASLRSAPLRPTRRPATDSTAPTSTVATSTGANKNLKIPVATLQNQGPWG